MTVKPEDVRAHLAAKQGEAGAAVAAAGEAVAGGAAAVAAVREEGIIKVITASYFLLRRGLALLAFALPIALVLGAGWDQVQPSISAYYHFSTPGGVEYGAGTMRDVFVAVLCAVGAFLFFYKGYSWQEDWALNIAGLAIICVAMFPMDWPADPDDRTTMIATVHHASTIAFFLAIACVCLLLSGDTLELMKDETRKRRFKRTYALLGALLILIPLSVTALHFLRPVTADTSPWVLLVEVSAVYVFCFFWLVKSREIAILERQ
jgi:hypothetical protein